MLYIVFAADACNGRRTPQNYNYKEYSVSVRYLSPRAVCERLQVGRSTLTYWQRTNPEFPKPIYLGPRSPRYVEAEIQAWLEAQRETAPTLH